MPQASATLSSEIIEKIKKLSEDERRSMSEMISLLLEEAISNRDKKLKSK